MYVLHFISAMHTNFYKQGVAILFGTMFGANGSEVHAYNWYLGKDLNSITFFEPKNGEEKVKPGYRGYFAVF